MAVLAGLKSLDDKGARPINGLMLAEACLMHGNLQALKLIATRQPGGITIEDCCRSYVEDRLLIVSSDDNLYRLVTKYPSAKALRLACELLPNDPAIASCVWFDGASIHYELIRLVTIGAKTVPAATAVAETCRVALEYQMPIAAKLNGHAMTMPELFFRNRWHRDGVGEVVVPLISDYVKAGVLDLNVPDGHGLVPVAAAIKCGNGEAAAAAIDLGCDIALATQTTRDGDLLTLARETANDLDREQVVALVTEALMRRRINAAGTVQHSSPGAVHVQSPRAARARL
ncbi:hypothetical protein [Roseateles asaccharophilus]|uniref:hypothetical protein n=1 Tax=Roseateles asaccharophilus TaxID=582607 RepID=UPI00384ECC69